MLASEPVGTFTPASVEVGGVHGSAAGAVSAKAATGKKRLKPKTAIQILKRVVMVRK
jgi:hypothetical protein